MVLVTVLCLGGGAQWHQGKGLDECALASIDIGGFVSVIVNPHGDCLLTRFFLLQRAEDILTKVKNKVVQIILLLWSE